jgi:hypothetical protein
MERTLLNQPVSLFPCQPSVQFNFAQQHADFREAVDSLRFVPRHMEQVANERQIAIDRRRLVAPLELPLRDGPHDIPEIWFSVRCPTYG